MWAYFTTKERTMVANITISSKYEQDRKLIAGLPNILYISYSISHSGQWPYDSLYDIAYVCETNKRFLWGIFQLPNIIGKAKDKQSYKAVN